MAWELVNRIAQNKIINIDLITFYEIVGRINDVENKKIDETQVKDRIVYAAAYPDYVINESDQTVQIPANLITYSTVTREPAPIGEGHRQLRPIKAAVYRDTETNDTWTLLLIRYLDTVRFDAFAPSASEVELLMTRWEAFMNKHMQLIEHIGMERIIYNGRGLTMTTMSSGYHNRSALYQIITEEHIWRKDQAIDDITMEYGLTGYGTETIEFPDRTE